MGEIDDGVLMTLFPHFARGGVVGRHATREDSKRDTRTKEEDSLDDNTLTCCTVAKDCLP